MSEEEKKALKVMNARTKRLLDELEIEKEDMLDEPRIAYLMQEIRANKTILSLIEKLQKENEELKTELERQKDINIIINQKGLEKNYEKALEKTMTKFLKNNIDKDVISVQRIKEKIEKEIKYHKKNILDIENETIFKEKTIKEEAEIEFNKYAILVLNKVLQELIEESEEK